MHVVQDKMPGYISQVKLDVNTTWCVGKTVSKPVMSRTASLNLYHDLAPA